MRWLGLTQDIWVLDIESKSPVDIKKQGQYIYWSDPATTTLMMSTKQLGGDTTYLWDFEARKDVVPEWFRAVMQAPREEVMLAAANCEFDRQGLVQHLGFTTPDEKWLDVLVMAYILGFAGRLDDVLKQTPLGITKKPEGTRLITLFCAQQTPWHQHPDKWETFRGYCVNDADVEERLLLWCMNWLNQPWAQPVVRRIWEQDIVYRRINRRGIPIDTHAVQGALVIRDQEMEVLTDEMKDITGLANPNSRDQLLGWLRENGIPNMPDLQKNTVRDMAALNIGTRQANNILKLRAETGKTSVKKFDALKRATGADGRMRGGWQFYGASRSGRVAGRVLNPANLARPGTDHPEEIAAWLPFADRDLLSTLFPEKPVLDTLSSSIRACLKAPEGKDWCVADLTSIESVGAAWLAGCQTILDIFKEGRDTYKTFATRVYDKPYEEVTKEERKFCKPGTLGAAYMLSGYGLVAYAHGMGVTMDESEGARQISIFRDEYHEIVHYWDQLKSAAINAVKFPGQTFHAYAVDKVLSEYEDWRGKTQREYSYKDWPRTSYWFDGTFLFCFLPSGRFLSYYKPSVDPNYEIAMRDGHSFTTEALLYYGTDQNSPGNQWKQIGTHAGKLLENNTQALCRDAMWFGLEQAEEDPDFEVVGDVYDEIMTLVAEGNRDALDTLVRYMTSRAPWMDEEFFLGADGYIDPRFRKD